uniref:C2H2-type domain-containing protein n=1 Tax=Photinus pyralis TaxID=7054 RepID=A0A1Y1LDT6_PHOPY
MDNPELEDIAVFCFLCKKGNISLVDIRYKTDRNSVKENLMELYGDAVETYLGCVDLVCWNCAHIVESMAFLKRHLYEVIVDHHVSVQVHDKPGTRVFDVSSTWSYLNFDNPPDSAASPNDLLMVTGSIPYVERCDNFETNFHRYRYDTPALDREVQRVTSRSRSRRKGHNWTRKKGSQNRHNSLHSRTLSRYSYTSRGSKTSRVTAVSGTSRTSASSRKKHLQDSLKKYLGSAVGDLFYRSASLSRFSREYLKKNYLKESADLYELDDIVPENSLSIRTRFATKIRNELMFEYNQLIYECPHSECGFTEFNIEKLTTHRVEVHKEMAMFLCEQCNFYYISQKDLDKHIDVHFKTFLAYCIYCWAEYRNKRSYEAHLNEHLLYSYPCSYCDKFFLSKKQKEIHVKVDHSDPDKRVRKPKRQLILDRIDKVIETESDCEQTESTNQSSEFVVKILCQHGNEEEARVVEDNFEETDMVIDTSLNLETETINFDDIMS